MLCLHDSGRRTPDNASLVLLAVVVALLAWRATTPTDAKLVATGAHWGPCTQAHQIVHCTAIATVTNQGGRNVMRYQYLALYITGGDGCDSDIPPIDPGASETFSCVVTIGSNFPPGFAGDQTPIHLPRAFVQP